MVPKMVIGLSPELCKHIDGYVAITPDIRRRYDFCLYLRHEMPGPRPTRIDEEKPYFVDSPEDAREILRRLEAEHLVLHERPRSS